MLTEYYDSLLLNSSIIDFNVANANLYVVNYLCFSLYARAVDREIYQYFIPSIPSSFDLNCCLASLHLQVISRI